MEFRLLGPLEVVGDDGAFGIDAHKPRALLALLLLHANEIVQADRLIDALWAGSPPASATKLLQTYVSQVRKELGPERIVTKGPGYLISVAAGELDLDRFEDLRAQQPHEALALWRGTPLADFEYDAWAQPEIARLEEARLVTLEARIEVDLARGWHGELVAELDSLVRLHPLREHLRWQLMLTLYRCGRQAEALEVYRQGRLLLSEELGIEPSPELRGLERSILRQDPALEASPQPRSSEPDSLVGREAVLREIAHLLEASRLTTLVGPGGIGKTRLALEASKRAAARHAGGATVVELAALTESGLVAAEVARVLDVREPTIAALLTYLSGKQLLLVLDNFEHVAAAAPLLDELLLGAPGLSVLVTSRVPLHLASEARYVVPPLELPDPAQLPTLEGLGATEAVALFVERARAVRPEFELLEENAAAVAQLCVRLDGLPLALELAGARAGLLSPAAILARLGRRLDLLKAADPAVPARHRTLRAAIEWSYELLDENERQLFSALAVFNGGFSADAAEVVTRLDVLEGLPILLDSSLVRPEKPIGDEPRFGMLETIREYARERLADRLDAEELRRRHAETYQEFAAQAEPALRGPEQVAWLRRLDGERENLRAALRWAATSGATELGLQTASGLWRYWQFRGAVGEGMAHLRRLLSGDGRIGTAVRAEALAAAGRLAFMDGDLEAAASLLQESLVLEHEPKRHSPLRATSLAVLALVARAQGDPPRAEKLLDESVAAAREGADWFSHALALIGRGELAYVDGDFDVARRNLEEGVRAAREIGDIRNIARGLTSVGAVALEQLEYERATRLLEEALALQRELGDRWGIARSLISLGVAARGRGDSDGAEALFEQGLSLQLDADDRPGIAASLEQIAELSSQRGDYECAACLHGAAAILREMVGAHPMQLVQHRSHETIAAVAAALGSDAFAEAWSRGRAMTVEEAVAYALEQMRRNEHVHTGTG